jgi:hypothetical protein
MFRNGDCSNAVVRPCFSVSSKIGSPVEFEQDDVAFGERGRALRPQQQWHHDRGRRNDNDGSDGCGDGHLPTTVCRLGGGRFRDCGGGRRSPSERGHVGALRQVDDDRVGLSFVRVVGVESGAQAAGFDADQGIQARVVRGGTAEDFDPQDVLFQPLAPAAECLLHQEAEQALQLAGAREGGGGRESVEGSPDLRRRDRVGPVRHVRGHGIPSTAGGRPAASRGDYVTLQADEQRERQSPPVFATRRFAARLGRMVNSVLAC